MAERRERTRIKRPSSAPEVEEVRPAIAEQIRAAQGGGAALEPSVQTRMEAGFGHNFADVRVHADEKADALSQSVGAKAFTLDRDIFLSQAASSDGAAGGDQLLAHELAHVVQQRGAVGGRPLAVAPAADASERDAERAGASALQPFGAGHVQAGTVGRAMIQRWPWDDEEDKPAPGDTKKSDAPAGDTKTDSPADATSGTWGSVIGAIARDPVKASTGYRGPVTVDEWHERRLSGPVPASAARKPEAAYIGDSFVVSAKVSGPAAAAVDTLYQYEAVVARPNATKSQLEIKRRVTGPDTLEWTITPMSPGHQDVKLRVADAMGQNADELSVDIAAGADPAWFKGRCSTAETFLNMQYAKGQSWFYDCYVNYLAAYRAFDGALRAQDAANRLVGELLLSALFVAGGGIVGGAVAGKLGGMMEDLNKGGKVIFQGLSKAAQGAITTTAEDMVKWAIGLPAGPFKDMILAGQGSGAGAGGQAQASTDASKVGVAQGEGAVAAIDPENWFALIQRAINNERAAVGLTLMNMQKAIDMVAITDPTAVQQTDPLQIVSNGAKLDGKPLDQLGKVPDSVAYERSMWEVWLTNYAWTVIETYGALGTSAIAANAVGGKLEDEIDRVAKKFGESGEDWIERYGGKSKSAAMAKAAKINEKHPWNQAVGGVTKLLEGLNQPRP
jgi:hypothetical protein